MDRNIIEAKLESLRRCVDRIAEKAPASADQLIHDPDLQDIIALNLQRAVQTSVDLAAHLIAESDSPAPSTMAEHFEILDHLQIISPALARITHERFCCNRGFAAATSLSAGGLAARLVDILFKDAFLPPGGRRPVVAVNRRLQQKRS